MSKKFDYKSEVITMLDAWGKVKKDYEKILQQYGDEGYELVHVHSPKVNYEVHIFKKEL